jgi:hypothetical protein
MRRQPYLLVECDNCEVAELVKLTVTAKGYDKKSVDLALKNLGWDVKDDKDYCCECNYYHSSIKQCKS